MFDSFYPIQFIQCDSAKSTDSFEKAWIFKFKDSENKLYVVRAEEFANSVFAIKFYPKSHKRSDNKFTILTKRGRPQPIFRTCINVMLEIYDHQPLASFTFKGVPVENENEDSTKRFRIYKRLMENFFSPERFSHYQYSKNSIYLLLNRRLTFPDPLRKIENQFVSIFDVNPSKR